VQVFDLDGVWLHARVADDQAAVARLVGDVENAVRIGPQRGGAVLQPMDVRPGNGREVPFFVLVDHHAAKGMGVVSVLFAVFVAVSFPAVFLFAFRWCSFSYTSSFARVSSVSWPASAMACFIRRAEVASVSKETVAMPLRISHAASETPLILAAFSMRCLHMPQLPATSKAMVTMLFLSLRCCAKFGMEMPKNSRAIAPLYMGFMVFVFDGFQKKQ